MAPPADPLDQAFLYQEDLFKASMENATSDKFYLIAYFEGAKVECKTFNGKPEARLLHMQTLLHADPTDNRDWVVAEWDNSARRWKTGFLSGKGPNEQKLMEELRAVMRTTRP